MFDVIAIGSATRDNFLEGKFPTISWPKTPTKKAYALPLGEKLEASRVYATIGGNAANASVTFARQGLKVAAVAKTGTDFTGEDLKRRLRTDHVDVSLITHDPNLPTAYSVLILEKGERTIIGYHGASNSFSIKDVRLSKMKSKWWYVSLAGESDKMLSPLLRFAHANRIAVAFNPSGYHITHRRAEVQLSLKYISFLAVNDEEAALIAGVPWTRERDIFKKLGGVSGVLAVTRGAQGSILSDGKFMYHVGVFKEKKLVDRTGAGDAFGAGFVAGLLRRGITLHNISCAKPEDISYAARLATANATANVEMIGATEGTLTAREFRSPRWAKLPIRISRIV